MLLRGRLLGRAGLIQALPEPEQLCRSSPVIGRPQGWRWRAPAYGGYGLDPARSPVCWLCTALGR